MINLIRGAIGGFDQFAANKLPSVASLFLRLAIARMFFKAGWLKLQDLESAADLFQYEWFSDENWWMQLVGVEEIPRLLAVILGLMATAGEIILPVLLVFGLLTRFAAAGLMIMALVIVLLVYPLWTADGLGYWWNDHMWWVVSLLAILALGGQRFSVDYWFNVRK